jgi:hypothetical protein
MMPTLRLELWADGPGAQKWSCGAGWRVGRVAEGGGLLNRCRTKSSTGGSNPPLSAIPFSKPSCSSQEF